MKRSRVAFCGAACLVTAMSAVAGPPVPLTPRAPTGYSSLEQRYAYAPPDKGRLEFELRTGGGFPTEVVIEEPSMCEGSANIQIDYDKRHGRVALTAEFNGLPYRMSYAREVDISTPYNQFPVSIEDGVWQIWFVGRMFNFSTNYYYDLATMQLLGAAIDFESQPPGSLAVPLPTLHMFASPLFEGRPDGKAKIRFEFDYQQMLDEQGMGGVYFSLAPASLCKPDEYVGYYSKPLPASMALNFDQVLESIHQGYGMAIATSLEPRVKPEYLLSRDNTMIGWSGAYPQSAPEGYVAEDIRGTLKLRDRCETRVLRDYPKARYNLCAGF